MVLGRRGSRWGAVGGAAGWGAMGGVATGRGAMGGAVGLGCGGWGGAVGAGPAPFRFLLGLSTSWSLPHWPLPGGGAPQPAPSEWKILVPSWKSGIFFPLW